MSFQNMQVAQGFNFIQLALETFFEWKDNEAIFKGGTEKKSQLHPTAPFIKLGKRIFRYSCILFIKVAWSKIRFKIGNKIIYSLTKEDSMPIFRINWARKPTHWTKIWGCLCHWMGLMFHERTFINFIRLGHLKRKHISMIILCSS